MVVVSSEIAAALVVLLLRRTRFPGETPFWASAVGGGRSSRQHLRQFGEKDLLCAKYRFPVLYAQKC